MPALCISSIHLGAWAKINKRCAYYTSLMIQLLQLFLCKHSLLTAHKLLAHCFSKCSVTPLRPVKPSASGGFFNYSNNIGISGPAANAARIRRAYTLRFAVIFLQPVSLRPLYTHQSPFHRQLQCRPAIQTSVFGIPPES